jgi:hypothetical protein
MLMICQKERLGFGKVISNGLEGENTGFSWMAAPHPIAFCDATGSNDCEKDCRSSHES